MGNNGGVYTWSQTAANNATADNSVNWAEGQAPSSINDSARAMMASVAKFRDDISGSIVTTGTSTAYIVASNQNFDTQADFNGKLIAFTPHVTNGNGPVTMTVDGFANLPLRSAPNTELLSGVLIKGTPYAALFNSTDGALYLQGFFGNPYSVPLGAGMDFWGSTAPNSSFAFPMGQQISITTYASLYTLFGPNKFGTDTSSLFYLPDKTGRVSAMQEASESRLTPSYFGGNSTTLGAVGGGESHTLILGEIPGGITSAASTPWNVTGDSNNSLAFMTSNAQSTQFSASAGAQVWEAMANGATVLTQNVQTSGSVTSNNTGGGAHRTVQPTIVCNYILRII